MNHYTRLANWLREANHDETMDSLIARCNVAANAINNLERKLKITEGELVLCQDELRNRMVEPSGPLFSRFFKGIFQ